VESGISTLPTAASCLCVAYATFAFAAAASVPASSSMCSVLHPMRPLLHIECLDHVFNGLRGRGRSLPELRWLHPCESGGSSIFRDAASGAVLDPTFIWFAGQPVSWRKTCWKEAPPRARCWGRGGGA
jgi:hypothetical protein